MMRRSFEIVLCTLVGHSLGRQRYEMETVSTTSFRPRKKNSQGCTALAVVLGELQDIRLPHKMFLW